MEKSLQTKTIGMIGGIGWASTAEYYRLINEMTVKRTGITHSARIVILSLDQFDFISRAAQSTPAEIENFLVEQGNGLKTCGADLFIFCANGAHRFASAVVPRIGLPFVSIVEETTKRVQGAKLRKVGLLGVKQTMAGRFYQDCLAQHDIDVLTPSAADQDALHEIIYSELIHQRINDASRAVLVRMIEELAANGAGGVILGCTEIPLLISPSDVSIPVFNTTEIHCEAVVAMAFGEN